MSFEVVSELHINLGQSEIILIGASCDVMTFSFIFRCKWPVFLQLIWDCLLEPTSRSRDLLGIKRLTV